MTAELGDDPEAFPQFLLERTPLGRGGRTGELDEAVLFLLGRGSSFVTGHVLSVDGGMAVAMTPKPPPPPIKLLNRPLAIWRLLR